MRACIVCYVPTISKTIIPPNSELLLQSCLSAHTPSRTSSRPAHYRQSGITSRLNTTCAAALALLQQHMFHLHISILRFHASSMQARPKVLAGEQMRCSACSMGKQPS